MATIATVRYGYTFNRGNFQSERIDMEMALSEGDDPIEQFYCLKGRVLGLGGDTAGAIAAEKTAYLIAQEIAQNKADGL